MNCKLIAFAISSLSTIVCGICVYATLVWKWRYEYLKNECLQRGYVERVVDSDDPKIKTLKFIHETNSQ